MKHLFLSIVIVAGLVVATTTFCDQQKPSATSDDSKTYSISLRVRKVIYEDAYVAVPVTDAIMKKKEDGTMGIDFDKFVKEALRISEDPKVEWKVEESKKEPHQIQQGPPEGRKSFDAFYDTGSPPKDTK